MTAGAPLVIELLNYIEQVEKLNSKPPFSVPTEYFVAHQHDLKGLPELQFNAQAGGDDVWMRLPRLQEIVPPEPDPVLLPWLTTSKSPTKLPELKGELVTYSPSREELRVKLSEQPEVRELFDWYVEFQWSPWATAEAPRRRTIAQYNKLFALQQAMASEGAETPLELVWGVGFAAWKKEGYGTPVRHPMMTQSCEIGLNEKTFELEVRPRDVEPKLEADCYAEMGVSGLRHLEAHWKSSLETGIHRVNPFEASTFEGVLKAAVGHLDPTGSYEVRIDDVAPPQAGDKLKVTNTWVLFARKRSGDILLEDVRRLKKAVAAASELPGVIRSFVEPGSDVVRAQPSRSFRGLSSSESLVGGFELYFPMAYNEEQVSIVQKLDNNDGVVVQGPPGTGKTHTIANVICHYLAQGKRVLVTAKGESPLAVLQEKLPERIRPLSVALLSNEREGMHQFEHSIQTIAAKVDTLNPAQSMADIAAAEAKLDQLHARVAHLDRKVAEQASRHLDDCRFHGRVMKPEELAKLVLAEMDQHDWFDDEPTLDSEALAFGDADIGALRKARMTAAEDIVLLKRRFPAPDALPVWTEVVKLHKDLVRARQIEASVNDGSVLNLVDSGYETYEKAKTLATWLRERDVLVATLKSAPAGLSALTSKMSNLKADDPVLRSFMETSADIAKLATQRRSLQALAVEIPGGVENAVDYTDAIARLLEGKSAFALPFGKGEARKQVAATSVLGSPATSKEDWQKVQQLVEWRKRARKASALWLALSNDFGLPAPAPGVEQGFLRIAGLVEHVQGVHRIAFDFNAQLHARIRGVFGEAQADRLHSEAGESILPAITAALQVHLDKGRLAYAMKGVGDLVDKLQGCSGPVVDTLNDILTNSLGSARVDEGLLRSLWEAARAELKRISALRLVFEDIERVSAQLEAAGALNWAKRLRSVPAHPDIDSATPSQWREAWDWRRACMFLEGIDNHEAMRALFLERRTLTTALARTYQDLVAEKTWLGVFNNAPPLTRQALQTYLQAVHAMGAGTGVRAIRHRRTARDAMLKAYKAVPCWVLPHWRVSETIPPDIGLFDLVVVDEASQSDISALPALLRGKKLLVVGDHKQVSPSAVGTAEEKIKELMARFLASQPHGSEMTPDKSIYDLARVVFAGNSVMLREHFRCVPAIIEFSNREFYQGDIKALRLPKANERLDPPLVDVFVRGGARNKDSNPAEAKSIVDEIESILADEQFVGRSIGVVTLQGTAQAALIHQMVSERISPVDVIERRIAIGPPPVFQGRERDIMLVSMVVGPGDRAAASRADIEQRFNVALSRARDRMYLFRSVNEASFRPETLNARLMRHFRSPFTQDVRKVEQLRDRCESDFEKEMFDILVQRGFRVEPQVECGGYRIDFVVEGNEGRRLAIECDGDRFHGPGQWSADMARQRVLERAGWTFWRCFASSFTRRRAEVVADLMAALAGLGIEALGAESVDNTVWVTSKEVDPYGLGMVAEEPAANDDDLPLSMEQA